MLIGIFPWIFEPILYHEPSVGLGTGPRFRGGFGAPERIKKPSRLSRSAAARSLPPRFLFLNSSVVHLFFIDRLTRALCPRRFHIFFPDRLFCFCTRGLAAVARFASSIRVMTSGSDCPAFIEAIQAFCSSGFSFLFRAVALTLAR